MNGYWKDFFDTSSRTPGRSLQQQVGKTLNGEPLSGEQLDLIVSSAIEALKLAPEDSLVDLCCGNGLITERLAPLVNTAWGVDFSEGLIEVAKKNSKAGNVEYALGNVLELDSKYFSGTKKILMNEALQHFVARDFDLLLEKMSLLSVGSLAYFSGMPDRDKIWLYYDTPEKRAFYENRELEGRPHSGNWWSRSEILEIASGRNFKATIIAQKPAMITAYYRFDVLIERT